MKEKEYVWLSKLDMSNETKMYLIEKFEGVKNLYNCSLDDLVYFGIKDNLISKILDKKIKDEALYNLEYMKKNKIEIISFEDSIYPKNFNYLKDKPICFYLRGNKEILDYKSIAIVGSRIALKESLEISRLVANGFSIQGINIISGLAKGIDKYAHLGALDSKRQRKNYRSFSKWIR